MYITKWHGFFITPLAAVISFACLIVLPMGGIPEMTTTLWLVFVGFLMQQYGVIPAGTRGELVFFGLLIKDGIWENGPYAAPSVFPFLSELFGFTFGWDVKIPTTSIERRRERLTGFVHFDSRSGTYNKNVPMNVRTMLLLQLLDLPKQSMLWVWEVPHKRIKRLGIVVTITGLVAFWVPIGWEHLTGTISSTASSAVNGVAVNSGSGVLSDWFSAPQKPSTTEKPPEVTKARVFVQLEEGQLPIMPNVENFQVMDREGKQLYDYMNDDPRKYFYYMYRPNGASPQVRIEEPTCSIVPAGKEIRIATDRPPNFVVNMKNSVVFMKRHEAFTWWERFGVGVYNLNAKIFGGRQLINDIESKKSWKWIRQHWESVENENYVLTANAMDKDDLPEDQGGGMVCF